MKKRLFILFLVTILLLTNSLFATSSMYDYKKSMKKQKYISALDDEYIEKRNQQIVIKEVDESLSKVNSNLLNLVDSDNSVKKKETLDIFERMDIVKSSDDTRSNNKEKSSEDLVYVYIQLTETSDINAINAHLNQIIDQDDETHILAAWIEISKIEEIATLDEVLLIDPVVPPVVGSIVTEGDSIHQADTFRQSTGLAGEGIKIGVISDGVNSWTDAKDQGELPDVTVLSDNTGGDEGTALLEIIHDLAPDAELYFHDCGQNTIAFKEAISALADSGCHIIVDDISWPTEPYFEDGTIARFLKKTIKNSRKDFVYITSAGNTGMGHYQDTFNGDTGNFHDFSQQDGIQSMPVFVPPNGLIQVILQWDDRFGKSKNDYDLYLFDESYTLLNIEGGMTTQNGRSNPMEYTYYYNTTSEPQVVYVDIHKYRGEDKTLELYVYGGYILDYSTNEDSIYGHAAVPEVISVGAINVNHYDGTPNTSYDIAEYSSQGDVTIVYPRKETRKKPDVCGISGVSVSGAGGFPSTFYGTSASAPHIAGLAALIWCQYPDKKASQIKNILLDHTIDLGEPGRDSVYGYGLADISNAAFIPTKPTILFAIPLDESVILSWMPSTDSNVTGYEISYKQDDEEIWTQFDVKKRKTSIKIEDLENSEAYEFRVRTIINKTIYSDYSDSVTATPISLYPEYPFNYTD